MGSERAMRSRGNSYASKGSSRTVQIVAYCAVFCSAIMAVPTLMALGKCWGWW